MHLDTLWHKFAAFRREQHGNISIVFSLAIVPFLLAAGLAADYGRAVNAKNVIQSASDAAALAAAAMTGANNTQRTTMAQSVFAANFNGPKNIQVGEFEVTFYQQRVRVTANAAVDTALMKLVGVDQIPVSITTEVNMPSSSKAEIALVLDYSGSMNGSLNGEKKYITMRRAAKELVSDLTQSAESGDVKISLVPFSHHVLTSLPGEYVIGGTPDSVWTGCTYDRKAPYNVTQDTPIASNDASKWGNIKSIEKFDKHDCSGYESRSLYLQPLTSHATSIQSQLDEMIPYAWTNIALGMAFGWHTLSPNPPFNQGAAYNDGTTLKAIVLLTDGAQTAYSWGPDGKQKKSHGENNLEQMCQNVKNLNDDPDDPSFIIITVAFDLDDEDTVNRLHSCATSDEHFYEAESNNQLSAAFESITEQLGEAIALKK